MNKEIYEVRKKIVLEFISDKNYRPMKLKEMCTMLGVPRREREELKQVLDQLISEGEAAMDDKGRYKAADEDVLTGTFIGNTKGFGFVHVEGMADDFYIAGENTKNALHGDEVVI